MKNYRKNQSQYQKDLKILSSHGFIDLTLIFQSQFEFTYRGYQFIKSKQETIKKQRYIKVVKTKLLSPGEKTQSKQEIECLKSIHHKNITMIIDAIEEPSYGTLMCVYPYNINVYFSLGKLLRTCFDQMDPYQRMRILKGIINGLKNIHKRGHAFKYLNPENILIDEDHQPQICFSVGGRLDINLEKYIAPEARQMVGKSLLSADIWSFGIIMFQILTGLPYRTIRLILGKYLNDIVQLENMTKQQRLQVITKQMEMIQESKSNRNKIKSCVFRMFQSIQISMERLIFLMLLKQQSKRPTLDEIDSMLDQIASRNLVDPNYKFERRKIEQKNIQFNLFPNNQNKQNKKLQQKVVNQNNQITQGNENGSKNGIQTKQSQSLSETSNKDSSQKMINPQRIKQGQNKAILLESVQKQYSSVQLDNKQIIIKNEKPGKQTNQQFSPIDLLDKKQKQQSLAQQLKLKQEIANPNKLNHQNLAQQNKILSTSKISTAPSKSNMTENDQATQLKKLSQSIYLKKQANQEECKPISQAQKYTRYLQINAEFYEQAVSMMKQVSYLSDIQQLNLKLYVSVYQQRVFDEIIQEYFYYYEEYFIPYCQKYRYVYSEQLIHHCRSRIF